MNQNGRYMLQTRAPKAFDHQIFLIFGLKKKELHSAKVKSPFFEETSE